MGKWLDLIRENEEKILEAGKVAYKEALEAPPIYDLLLSWTRTAK